MNDTSGLNLRTQYITVTPSRIFHSGASGTAMPTASLGSLKLYPVFSIIPTGNPTSVLSLEALDLRKSL
jgi:hypothetical protein